MRLKAINSGLTGNACLKVEYENVMIFTVPGSLYKSVESTLILPFGIYRLFWITSGFVETSG